MDKDPFSQWFLENGSCLSLIRYSLDVLKKKTKVLDIFNTDKICFMKIVIESSSLEIWIRIRFHNESGSPSLLECIFGRFVLIVSSL